MARTRSPWNGYHHGYGWWSRRLCGHRVNFAWGYGGQFVFVVPDLDLTVVMTSDPSRAARGYRSRLFSLLTDHIMTALEPASAEAG
jgi:CubicO group peptidase (beta-lactamase class C family)